MTDETCPDIDAATIGTGCATGFKGGCFLLMWISALVACSGQSVPPINPYMAPNSIKFLGLLLWLSISFMVGRETAHKAPYLKMLHAIVVGALMLLCGIVIMLFNPPPTARNPFNFLAFLLVIPMTMWGAHYAISSQQPGPVATGEPEPISPNEPR